MYLPLVKPEIISSQLYSVFSGYFELGNLAYMLLTESQTISVLNKTH